MGLYEHRTNYSNGYVVEFSDNKKDICYSWLLFPAENLWPIWIRGILYIAALAYLFIGIAIGSDIFMCSIEVITSKKRKVIRWDDTKKEQVEHEILVWNETVANLTLLALGSSAPEILLAVIESVTNIGYDMSKRDGLGTFTIIGSAAFNLLIITSICIVSVPKPEVKQIREFGVFLLTAFWSMWAYVWMLLVVRFISPGEIEIWEALVTLAFFPLFVILAYCQDNGWWCKRRRIDDGDDIDVEQNMRVMDLNRPRSAGMGHIPGKELYTLEAIRNKRLSICPDTKTNSNEIKVDSLSESQVALQQHQQQLQQEHRSYARARFRHAVVMAMTGQHMRSPKKVPQMADIVNQIQILKRKEKSGLVEISEAEEYMKGRFSFSSSNYAIMESSGVVEVDILFHQRVQRKLRNNSISNWPTMNNGSIASSPITTSAVSVSEDPQSHLPDIETLPPLFPIPECVAVDYETREGSAKVGQDFQHIQGRMTFNEYEYKKTVSIPIVNDNNYENDVDFYILLKNPSYNCELGDPSVSRITIIDDDEPGVFLFDSSQYQADLLEGKVIAKVVRQWGGDGKVTIEYSTIDGTAVGGQTFTDGVDYLHQNGTLTFKHAEMSKDIEVDVRTNIKGVKNFIMSLRNPSVGAKIGETSAAVCNITNDVFMDRIADLLETDEMDDSGYAGQFKSAMLVGDDEARLTEYILHFLTFFWKFFFAIVPPTKYCGAWPTFIVSLGFVGILTAFVEQLGTLVGCVIGLENSVTGITIIALGTSLPDTFASRTAARQDEHADAAIGNITGSNSVNVFLGLGLPWIINSIYASVKGSGRFKVSTSNLTQSVIIFGVCGTICILLICLRRKYAGGELGGATTLPRLGSSLFLLFLWIVYVTLSSLKAYNLLNWNM